MVISRKQPHGSNLRGSLKTRLTGLDQTLVPRTLALAHMFHLPRKPNAGRNLPQNSHPFADSKAHPTPPCPHRPYLRRTNPWIIQTRERKPRESMTISTLTF